MASFNVYYTIVLYYFMLFGVKETTEALQCGVNEHYGANCPAECKKKCAQYNIIYCKNGRTCSDGLCKNGFVKDEENEICSCYYFCYVPGDDNNYKENHPIEQLQDKTSAQLQEMGMSCQEYCNSHIYSFYSLNGSVVCEWDNEDAISSNASSPECDQGTCTCNF